MTLFGTEIMSCSIPNDFLFLFDLQMVICSKCYIIHIVYIVIYHMTIFSYEIASFVMRFRKISQTVRSNVAAVWNCK